MPAGIPVATVAIGNGVNAGLLAVQILATADAGLAGRQPAVSSGSLPRSGALPRMLKAGLQPF
jgi:phosphoribosylcarboxyaminoimidazole (NCAIR) mutase